MSNFFDLTFADFQIGCHKVLKFDFQEEKILKLTLFVNFNFRNTFCVLKRIIK